MQAQPAKMKYETSLMNGNDPEERHTVSCETEGIIQKKRDAWYIRFAETEAEGLEGTNVIWKLTDSEALLLRNSSNSSQNSRGRNESIEMRQEFQVGSTRRGHYDTPYGRFELVTTTHAYQWNADELNRMAQLSITYEIELMGEMNRIQVNLTVNW